VVKIVARSRDQQVFGCLSQFRRVRRWPSEARLSFGYALSRRPPVFGNRSPGARRHARHPGRTRVISRRLPGTARRVWRDRQGATSKGERRGDPFGAPGNAGIQGGTESSNLLCSSAESDANSISAEVVSRSSLPRDRWFESGSLQRGVRCEPDSSIKRAIISSMAPRKPVRLSGESRV
jgi:hypothetical protein